MTCDRCRGKGLIRANYQSGEVFDIAICTCRAGHPYRVGGEALVRATLGNLPQAHQVALLEHFDGEVGGQPTVKADAFVAAGKTRGKAKL